MPRLGKMLGVIQLIRRKTSQGGGNGRSTERYRRVRARIILDGKGDVRAACRGESNSLICEGVHAVIQGVFFV